MLGFPLLYFKGMRLMMFQLSSFYCRYTKEPGSHALNPKAPNLTPGSFSSPKTLKPCG